MGAFVVRGNEVDATDGYILHENITWFKKVPSQFWQNHLKKKFCDFTIKQSKEIHVFNRNNERFLIAIIPCFLNYKLWLMTNIWINNLGFLKISIIGDVILNLVP